MLDTLLTPKYVLPIDTIACSDTAIISAATHSATYYWNTGEITSSISVTNEGQYTVTATIATCFILDTVDIYLNPSPTTSITSSDTITCAGVISRNATDADYYAWYTDSVGGNLIGQGNPFMYDAQTTDTIWVEGQNYSNKC